MAFPGIGARLLAGAHPVGDVPPVIGGDVMRLDADGFHRVDVAKHLFDPGPALDLQQNVAARLHEGQSLVGFARFDRAHDVDA